jgi:hypothetical protein
MANVLTSLAADLYKAADIVGREQVGIVPSVTINAGAEAVALNDTIRSSFTRTPSVGTITPSMTIPEGTDQTVDNKTLVLDQTASIKIPWTGEDIKHVNNGVGFQTVYGDQIAQAIRAMVNQVENFMYLKLVAAVSRSFGTAGTNPFASNFNAVAEIRQILIDNGMPDDGRATLVFNTLAGTKMRQIAQLQQVNTSGNDRLLRQGTLLDLHRLMMKESAAPIPITKGTGASYTTTAAGFAVGTTLIPIITGTGTVLAGDRVTFAGDTNIYTVAAGVSAPGTITLNSPGLRQAIPAAATAMTIGNNATVNIAVHQSAAELAMRPYATPDGGDAAIDSMNIQDPISGLSFNVSAYRGYKKAMFDISCVYGGTVWKPDFVAGLLG